ncbi:Type 1 glutamine amidotransferase-like domain-containing protein [Candidatus Saccharibacteria bacterium]|nr:Type 1 glutamine amidotransferase-like domain-containing protein [Candidatus Saccharibacteria bacterium]
MRLFLSSQDFGNYPEVAAKLAGKNKKAAYIKNAQDDLPPKERNFSTPEKKKMFEAAGFEFEELDLRDYFGEPDKLLNKLGNFGSFWSSGGNTFILRRAMKASGLDEVFQKLLKEDKIMYGGWSAGACVAAPSLHGIEYGDRPQPNVVPKNYPIKDTIWEGLNLVPFMVVPHYKSDWFGAEADRSLTYFKRHKIPCRPLQDGQVIVVSDRKVEFLK